MPYSLLSGKTGLRGLTGAPEERTGTGDSTHRGDRCRLFRTRGGAAGRSTATRRTHHPDQSPRVFRRTGAAAPACGRPATPPIPLDRHTRHSGHRAGGGKRTNDRHGTREVTVDSLDTPVPYDTLVYALGSVADTSTPGVAEHAATVAGPAEAQALRDKVATMARQEGTLTVVGGGLTGIETAAEVAETYPGLEVRLVTDTEPGAGLSERGRAHLRRVFDRLGVEVRTDAKVVEVHSDAVELADGNTMTTDLVVWATGFGVPDLAARRGISVDSAGRIVVDETLRAVSHPDVYAVGDSAAAHHPDGSPLRMACATALPLGRYAGDVIAARA